VGLQEILDRSFLFQSKIQALPSHHKNQEKQRHKLNPMHLIRVYKFQEKANSVIKKH